MKKTILGFVLIAGGFAGAKFLDLPPWAAAGIVVLGALIVEPKVAGEQLKKIATFWRTKDGD